MACGGAQPPLWEGVGAAIQYLPMKRLTPLLLFVALAAACGGGEKPAAPIAPVRVAAPTGNAERGKELVAQYGCNVCHTIPEIAGPRGSLGPSLAGVGSRPTITSAHVPNTPVTVAKFIVNPASVNPASSMPAMMVPDGDAQDIAAYLYTLK